MSLFYFSIAIGLYGYVIFLLGMGGWLYPQVIEIITFIYITGVLVFFFVFKKISRKIILNGFKLDKEGLLFYIIIVQIFVNLIGALGPELSFDSLWYHLTLPKLYLQKHSVFYIPGGLFYYSTMPKLTEMFYIAVLPFWGEIGAKLIHFIFGILTGIVLYTLSKKFVSRRLSLLAIVILFSNLVFAWESTVAFVDLSRTFFELGAFYYFVLWYKKKGGKEIYFSAILLGFASSVKMLSLTSLPIYIILIFLTPFYSKQKEENKSSFITYIRDFSQTRLNTIANILKIKIVLGYIFCMVLIPLPWFVFSYIHTGNLFFPFLSNQDPIHASIQIFDPFMFFSDLLKLFVFADDPISAIYIMGIPLIFLCFKKFNEEEKVIFYYSLISLFIWYVIPRIGGGRFILPYLPVFSLLVVMTIQKVRSTYVKSLFITSIVFYSLITVFYRGLANSKYIPVILGKETKKVFLSRHLNFDFGDFYDTDGFFENRIKKSDTVLLYGFHNLYYVNFPFIHESYVKKGDTFTYIATQNTELPKRFSQWTIVYSNNKTYVTVYSKGQRQWIY